MEQILLDSELLKNIQHQNTLQTKSVKYSEDLISTTI